jgi:nucleoside-diphosphate-sugar epimerase
MTRILVTGGAGFIGSVMVKQLLNEGFETICFDLPAQIEKNVPPKEATIYEGDILSLDDLIEAINGCDYVVHLAALLGVNRTETKRLECLDINILGTKNVLEACVKGHIEKIVFASSSDVYGAQIIVPISENNPLNPNSIYAISKLAGEEYLKAYKKQHNLNYTTLRFFGIYGPGQASEFVMSRFIKMVLNNKSPTIYGDGAQVRSFCYVEDAVKGAILALKNEKVNSEILNIGNDKEPISMGDLAYKIIALARKAIEPEFIPMGNSDRGEAREIPKKIPDISKARNLLGYEPHTSLEEGVLKIMEHGKFYQS